MISFIDADLLSSGFGFLTNCEDNSILAYLYWGVSFLFFLK
jgi:hypothetical protein